VGDAPFKAELARGNSQHLSQREEVRLLPPGAGRAVGPVNAPVTGSYASIATLSWHMNDTHLTHPHRKRLS
jgi:hypothetical protein